MNRQGETNHITQKTDEGEMEKIVVVVTRKDGTVSMEEIVSGILVYAVGVEEDGMCMRSIIFTRDDSPFNIKINSQIAVAKEIANRHEENISLLMLAKIMEQ